jgi:hypothetical protein
MRPAVGRALRAPTPSARTGCGGGCRARQAHLAGQVAGALKERAAELLGQEPAIERIDILAGKVDIGALQPQPS